jgi:hypothetical protein
VSERLSGRQNVADLNSECFDDSDRATGSSAEVKLMRLDAGLMPGNPRQKARRKQL